MGCYGTLKLTLMLVIFVRPFQLAILTHLLHSMKPDSREILLEAGCGVGNLFFLLLEEIPSLFIHVCDFSKRAVQFLKVRLFS